MPQSPAAMAIDRPITGFQVAFKRRDQTIETGIQDRTMVEVDDAMGSASVVPRPQVAVGGPLQRNHGPVAVAQTGRGGQQRPQGRRQAPQALQGGGDAGLFPLLLVFVIERLQAATAAMVRKDAGGATPPRRGGDQPLQLTVPQALGPTAQAHQQVVAGQSPGDDNDFAIKTTQALAMPVQIGDGERNGLGGRHQWEVQSSDPIGLGLQLFQAEQRSSREEARQQWARSGRLPWPALRPDRFIHFVWRCPLAAQRDPSPPAGKQWLGLDVIGFENFF